MSSSETGAGSDYGSVERGLAGDYQFTIGEILAEAWKKTNGSKGTFFLANLLYMAVLFGVGFVVRLATAIFDEVGLDLFDVLNQLIPLAFAMPMVGGIWILAIRRGASVPTSPIIVLSYFHLLLPMLGLVLMTYIFVGIGLALLVIPGLYLSVGYALAVPLLVEKGLGPWEALETSRKAVTKDWFHVLGLSLVLGLINIATVVTLLIGLIWTLPLTYISMGILYRKVFGIEQSTLDRA